MSLTRHRAVTGVRWSLAAHGGRQAIQLAAMVALVRLLSPEAFGIMSMAMVLVGFSQVLQDLGTSAALVQRDRAAPALLSTVFWVNTMFGLALAGILVAGAPLVASFFDEAAVAPLLSVLSLVFVLSGAGTVHAALLQRKLGFRALARVELWATVAGAVTGVGSAAAGLGVWSLAVQALTTAGVSTGVLWWSCRWRPRLVFSWTELRSVGGYSLWLTGFRVVNHVARNMDYILIGKFLGATELGCYTLAYKLMLYPVQHVSAVVGRVMFPVYARWQDDHDRFRRAFVKVSAAIATVTFPAMVGLVAVRGDLVATLFGPDWAPVAPLILILAPIGMLQSLVTPLGGIYQATGRTGLFFAWGLGAAALMVLAFFVGIRWGLIGVAGAYAIAQLAAAWPCFRIPFGLIGLSMRRFVAALWPSLACSVAMGLVVTAVGLTITTELTPAISLSLQVAVGVAVYAVLSWRMNRQHVRDVLTVAVPTPGAAAT